MKISLRLRVLAMTLLASAATTTAMAQVNARQWEDRRWTSGTEMLAAKVVDSKTLVLAGSGYFDAGYGIAFSVKPVAHGNYDMTCLPSGRVTLPDVLSYIELTDVANGDSWTRRSYQGVDVIVRKNRKGDIIDVYTPLDPGQTMRERADRILIMLLCGDANIGSTTYTCNGKEYTFRDDRTCSFAGQQLTYNIDCDETVPTNVIELSNGKAYMFQLTKEGINLYEARFNDDSQMYEKGAIYACLKADNTKPRWPYLSTIVIDKTFCIAASDVLPYIRNEIYARKGYTFSNTAFSSYFRSCTWYHAKGDNAKVKLSPIESLNIAILKNGE